MTHPAAGADRPVGLHVVGVNPALDHYQVLDTFTPFGVNRAARVFSRAGGKSLIVARAIRRLGGDVTLHGFLGGPVADVLADECRRLGIRDRHVRIAGRTRTTVVVVETSTGRTTVVNEPGPEISLRELHEFEATVTDEVRAGDFVLVTGSLPRGVPDDLYARLVVRAKEAGATVLLDASGAALTRGVAAGPDVVKVNTEEFQVLAGAADIERAAALLDAASEVRRRHGIGALVVTRGADGCVAVDGSFRYSVPAPRVDTVSPTGSGDSFFAALALTLARRPPGDATLADALRLGVAAGAANAVRLEPDIGEGADVTRFAADVDVRVSDAAGTGGRP